MLTLIYDGISVTPMRSEAPTKMFSSDDVPHGTDSVYVRAASILAHDHGKSISVPTFTQAEKDSKVTTRKSAYSAVETLINPILSVLEQTEVLTPSNEEIAVEFAKKDFRNQPLYVDEAAAEAALIDQRKTELATLYFNERINQFLDVPTLTQEWKDQFTAVESA